MGSKQSSADRQAQGYNVGFSGYKPGVNPVELYGPQQSNFNIGRYAGWEAGHKAYQDQQNMSAMWANMFAGMSARPQGPSYEDQMASQQAEYNRQLEEQRLAKGKADTQAGVSNYMNAANSAADYVNSEIMREQSNAALLGIDYKIDDEIKSQRISNYFATVWGEGDQSNLENLIGQFGNPEGFEGFTVKRGDPSAYLGKGESSSEVKASSKGIKPLIDDDEPDASVLGG